VSTTYALPRGVFTLSLDFELIWGTLDHAGPGGFARACTIERTIVVDRLLEILAEFEIPATWLVLGHLFLEGCSATGGVPHADVVRPTHAWHPDDWFRHDPCGTEASNPLFYGRALVRKIQACRVPQEIGCHSFSHVIFGDAGCSREAAASEIEASIAAARELGIEMRSFAFPRNSVGHLDLLVANGFRSFRGPGSTWYERRGTDEHGQRSALQRLAHLWDFIAARTPPVVAPQRVEPGILNIPGSMIYLPMHGVRRHIPVGRRVTRAFRGLDAAEATGRVFHLWFHPTNLADETEAMLGGLRRICAEAARRRAAGRLDVLSMGGIADRMAASVA
jgi:peptidoglycan/xylan/chitin deacetylase (PgdA/CDA1 family)